MKKPKFSEWIKFDRREELTYIREYPGVYLLAHFERKPSGNADFTSKKIVYIGETTRQTLWKRLYQFQRFAFKRKHGHSGGKSYNRIFLAEKTVDKAPNNLYVAILPVYTEGEEGKANIKYIERFAICKFFIKNKKSPECNTR